MSSWTFPHSTCERSLRGSVVQQPWSFGMNLVNAGLLMKDAVNESKTEPQMALISFVIFELVHAISHSVHLNRNIHEVSVHICGYAMSITTYRVFQKKTGLKLTLAHKLPILMMVITDLIVFSTIRGIYSIATGLSVLALVVAIHIPSMSEQQQVRLLQLIVGTVVLFGMFVAENAYCDTFLKVNFNYHPLVVETWGIFLFQMLSKLIRDDSKKAIKLF